MSDEDSFVILGTSPNSSLDIEYSLRTDITTNKTVSQLNESVKINGVTSSQLTSLSSSNTSQYSVVSNGDEAPAAMDTNGTNGDQEHRADSVGAAVEKLNSELITSSSIRQPVASIPSTNGSPATSSAAMEKVTDEPLSNSEVITTSSIKQPAPSIPSTEGSLATSFILGEINSDVLKATVYSQFPSFCSMANCPEEVVKLHSMMFEYQELKKQLVCGNRTMYDLYTKWMQVIKKIEDERRSESDIAKYRNENMQLRRDLETTVEQLNIHEEERRRDHEESIKSLSEKSAQIDNMRAQIQKLEQQQNASFEYIPKNSTDTTQSKERTNYVSAMKEQKVSLEEKMSEIVAENLEIKDMQSHYINEINCLKVNLVAAEELLRKAQADINFLKASDVEKSEMFIVSENARKALMVDVDVLRHQVELNRRDCKIEQEARENLAKEKRELISELQELQKNNHKLIEDAQRNYEMHARQVMSATEALPTTSTQAAPSPSPRSTNPIKHPMKFKCPVCGRSFTTLSLAQDHVNQCLDGN